MLGWTEWRRLETHYGLGVITEAVEQGMAACLIRRQPAGPLSHMILSTTSEAALMVANAAEPARATRDAQVALETLLSTLA